MALLIAIFFVIEEFRYNIMKTVIVIMKSVSGMVRKLELE